MTNLSGKHISFWMETTKEENFTPLNENISVDVAIVGAGIAGLTAAYLLKQAGKKVVVIEAERVATGASGHTTAKITSLHQAIYATLIDKMGEDKARLYGESNQGALEKIAAIIAEEQIDCDFSRQDAYTFADKTENLKQIKDEAEAAISLGLPASFVTETTLPFPVTGAVKFTNQAQFHVRKYLVHLAKTIDGEGSYLFESTRVKTVDAGEPCEVVTDRGVVKAKDVLVTTNLPILDQGLFFAKTFRNRSYLVAAKIKPEQAPDGMFIGVGDGYRSIRTTPYGDDLLLLIGGEGHKVGSETDTEERYLALEKFGREKFGIDTFDFRWSSQDSKSFDHIPYVGPLTPVDKHIFVATGFSFWGMTNGTLAAMLLTDRLTGKENPWADLYDSTRATPFITKTSMKQNMDVGMHWVGDRLKGLDTFSLKDLECGESKMATIEGKKVAAYRDDAGEIHAVSAVCSHLGCIVNWNSAEKSWDCPCHGARFACSGEVLNAPAVKALKKVDVD